MKTIVKYLYTVYVYCENKCFFVQDDERLRSERIRALKAKERFAQSLTGISSDPVSTNPSQNCALPRTNFHKALSTSCQCIMLRL